MHSIEMTVKGSKKHPAETGEVLYRQHGDGQALCPNCLAELYVLPSQPGDTKQIRYFCAACETRFTLNADG